LPTDIDRKGGEMAYNRPGDESADYRTLADLIGDLIDKPGEFFMRDRGCEALIYVEELDEILLISCANVNGSREMREEALRRKLKSILEEGPR
jgi:hypothetical protein